MIFLSDFLQFIQENKYVLEGDEYLSLLVNML